ncbi:YheO-like PAS domain protein [Candidatus Rubidus massiliensis]|nr:MAG: hypothetical protein BGO10_06050 [Chlamydia sp. 32-24]CDZ81744.1 YheO-like PAS domain protein [Candidatus Rubidus massiliensis]
MNNLNKYILPYIPMIEASIQLFHPFVEIAVHDLNEGKIVALYHNISKRKVGDISPLHELNVETKQFPDFFNPYYKKNWDGRDLKCTSITVRDDKKHPIALICINVDTSFFQEAQKVFNSFLSIEQDAENPVEMFGGKFDEQIAQSIEHYLQENNLSINHLNRDQKKELVQFLYYKGIFNFKNAAPFVANYLKISRGSIYNHIKSIGD